MKNVVKKKTKSVEGREQKTKRKKGWNIQQEGETVIKGMP